LARSSKIKIDVRTHALASSPKPFIKLSFKEGGRDEFYSPLETALSRKAWTDTTSVSVLADRRLQTRQPFDASQAGISGIMQRRQEEQKNAAEMTTQSFSDLQALMDKAKDMVHE
jgi:ESCRT-II complex subunit VPS36